MTKALIVKESAMTPPDDDHIVIVMADLKEYVPPRNPFEVYNITKDMRGQYVRTTA